MSITKERLAAYFDHTNLKAFAADDDFRKLCEESRQWGFYMVAINPAPVRLCKTLLSGTKVHVGAAVGFPLGQNTKEIKLAEAIDAMANGADEIDYVININRLKEKDYRYLEQEMGAIVEACRARGVLSKVIFENCYLNEAEKHAMCDMARDIRPDYIKTSTGFGTGGATDADVRLMVERVRGQVKVKAAGGVRTLDAALRMIDLGVSRIGTSAGVSIMEAFCRRE